MNQITKTNFLLRLAYKMQPQYLQMIYNECEAEENCLIIQNFIERIFSICAVSGTSWTSYQPYCLEVGWSNYRCWKDNSQWYDDNVLENIWYCCIVLTPRHLFRSSYVSLLNTFIKHKSLEPGETAYDSNDWHNSVFITID